jgi:predicted transcriptional regulator
MAKFRDIKTLQKFAAVHASIHNHFHQDRHLNRRSIFKQNLITAVAGQLGKVGAEPEQATEEKPEPAVSVRRSIRPDHLICLVCGQQRKTLKRHLAVRHDLSPAEYREGFGLRPDYPMMAPNYTQRRREVALATGLGRPQKRARRKTKASLRSPAKELSRPEAADARE